MFTDGTGTTSTYIYDKNGNTLVKNNGTIQPYDHDTPGNLGIYLESEVPYTYEKNTYDVFNRLVSTKTDTGINATYEYYPNNLRLSKTVNGAYTGFIWDGSQITAEFDRDYNLTNNEMLTKDGSMSFEEYYTIGVGRLKTKSDVMSENTIRREHGLPYRTAHDA